MQDRHNILPSIFFSDFYVLNEMKEKAIFVLRALKDMLPITDTRDLRITLENHSVPLKYGRDLKSQPF